MEKLYSPTRLHNTLLQYDFPGDRFIPNRSLMDLDQAQSLLTNRTNSKRVHNTKFNEVYRKIVEEKLNLDSEGKPFRMLVFRGSPKSSRKSFRHIDEMREEEAMALENTACEQYQFRRLPKGESRILDAPRLRNDFYLNIMDWGKNNVLAVALGSELFLWNAESGNVVKLLQVSNGDYPTSVAWSEDAKLLAVGYMHSKVELWDPENSKLIRVLHGHEQRVATVAWNSRILTSGSRDKTIINHDGRAAYNGICRLQAHTEEVCGLKWSERGNVLASGGNENLIYIWDSSKMTSSNYMYRLNEHCAAVKALAWCPYQFHVLASGGGTKDGCIKMWNTQKGNCIRTIDTNAQVCGLEWNRHQKEILSGHGFSSSEHQNHLCLWKYPTMKKVGELKRHESRVLHLSQSPDGVTVVSAGADETLRFWKVFGPASKDQISHNSDLNNLLSLKISPIR